MKEIKNYGYSPELEKQHQSPDDFLVGASSLPAMFLIPKNESEKYLPKGEKQNIGEEKSDCASRSPHNKLEADFTYGVQNHLFSKENEKWLYENGYVIEEGRVEFSDAFTAILSGTTREGNSMIRPLDSIRNNGLVPKSMLPQLPTFDEYYNPMRITETIKALGLDFKRRFEIIYERAKESQFETILNTEMLCTGAYAWPEPVNGEYPRVDYIPNHAFLLYKNPKFYAFDNYIDSVDGDFIKKLASNYDFVDVGYRVFIYKEKVPVIVELKKKRSFWQWLIDLLFINRIFKIA